MKEFDDEALSGIELGPEDDIVAYCHTCKKVIFVGNNKTHVSNMVLRQQVMGHANWFEEEHHIDVVLPKLNPHKIAKAVDFVAQPWLTTKIRKFN